MSGHPTIIEAGPGTIRRLCCGTSLTADSDASELISAALGAIDDRVALVGERPVAVDSLWGAALRSVNCGSLEAQTAMVVVHPSWWSSSRVGVVTSAAQTVADCVLARPRSSLMAQASGAGAAVAVEIAERLVVITGAEVVAIPRRTEPHRTAEEVAAAIAEMTRDVSAVVLIDAPSTVVEAPALARLIADAARGSGRTVAQLDDARLTRLARAAQQVRSAPSAERRSIARQDAEGACGGRCRSGRGGAPCDHGGPPPRCGRADSPDDIPGRRPRCADRAGELADAAHRRRARFGSGTSHVAVRSRGGVAHHPIAGAR